jgi:hypothetical protein
MVVAADNMLSPTAATTSTSVVVGNDSSSPSSCLSSSSSPSPTSLARMIINIQSANTISLSFQID